jgi:hypothetical protein
VGNKVVGYLLWSIPLFVYVRGGGHGGDHDGDRDDAQVVDGDNNVAEHISEVFPLVHGRGGNNEEDHISEAIDPLPPDPSSRARCL